MLVLDGDRASRTEAAGIEPASRWKQNPKQVALLPANALISHRIVPPLRPVSSRPVPPDSALEGHTEGTCGPSLLTRCAAMGSLSQCRPKSGQTCGAYRRPVLGRSS